MGYSLIDTSEADLDDFIGVDIKSHSKYIVEHSNFFGEWNKDILVNAFYCKRKLTFFKKLLLNDEVVGFLGYKHNLYLN
ncbi:hypothetical protein RBG61_11710 [Paludicola sp. MB14-C6]|uniref:hypothetical protein n=1 Tax=Paludihabitans sp. MB14-C6 TaxID=3070656 RepID=UPI0027DE1FF4|nr:hypothetical protein [Paludicola sp. MB14-C6]WMJ22648.1 hypothetical protein RBG61_11710 [Paludicola sp. MB14-C6]